jgi:hypothetical protein
MANRMRGSRFGFGGGRRSQATPLAGGRRPAPGPRARAWLGWAAAGTAVAVVAFFVGRAGSEIDIATPTASPSAAPLAITYGTALDPASGEAVRPADRFRAGDDFAYSVRLAAAPGVDKILVEIIRLDGASETIVQVPSEQGIVATSAVFAFQVHASTLLKAWGPGSYAMRIYLPGGHDPFATGRFTLVETPSAS